MDRALCPGEAEVSQQDGGREKVAKTPWRGPWGLIPQLKGFCWVSSPTLPLLDTSFSLSPLAELEVRS